MHVEKPADVAGFIKIINEIEETNPRGTRYIFDSITGMQDLWEGDEQIMRFFTRQCPRLYELDTVAYWILEKNAHSEKFRAQLSHITQVVIDLTIENGVCNLTVVKAVNHASSELLKPHSYEVINDTIEFIAGTDTGLSNIGRRIREIRQQKEISQAQLATAAGVTASTISQVENNTISLSLPALLRLTKALDISIGTLFDEKHGTSSDFLFRAKNRSPLVTARPGVSASAIIPEDAHNRFEASLVTIAPGAAVSPHFIVNKGDEFGFLLSGNVELEMHGRTYIMNEGDTVRFTADVPSRWANNSEKAAKLLWIVCR
jgi:transcriptional regulator with XRE-family HTH domain